MMHFSSPPKAYMSVFLLFNLGTIGPRAGLLYETAKKVPSKETHFGNRGHPKVLFDAKWVLNEHELPP